MPDYQFRAPANTQLSNTTGGTTALAENKDVVVQWVGALEPWETPFLTAVMSNEEFNNPTLKWGQSRKIRYDTTIPAAIYNAVL